MQRGELGFSPDCLWDMFHLKGSQTGEFGQLQVSRRGESAYPGDLASTSAFLPHLLLLLPEISGAISPFPTYAHLLWTRRMD